ncbi:MAG: HAMP domain-containing sensor histidine kinase [Rhodospirillales bacterium]|nr:HAMP domain-containing sensor histidine kinase [Rhodospirillales bacterium]
MFQTEIFRSTPFRLAAAFAAAIAAVTLLLFAFIYWQTEIFETARIDTLLQSEAAVMAGESEPEIVRSVGRRLAGDLFRAAFVGLFDADGQLLAGNLRHIPVGLPIDGQAHRVSAAGVEPEAPGFAVVRAVARRLPGGEVLVIARDIAVLAELREPVLNALELGLIPAFLLSLAAGALLSRRALARVKVVHETIERIMRGDLHERLPARGGRDDLDRLAVSINRMLDRIEGLLLEVKGVGDNIAHDLRTPLARARAKLERGRNGAEDLSALRGVVDTAVADLDQAIVIITALLRIGEIETGRRRSGFGSVSLADIAREAYDLYQPVCEEHRLTLELVLAARPVVSGDAELLMEAIANLLDNAVKFTPEGGRIRLAVELENGTAAFSVQDTGPGIPAAERPTVLRRFYRGEASRHTEGHGLGLSIVGAIVRLHEFRLALRAPQEGSGATFVILAGPGEDGNGIEAAAPAIAAAERRQPAPA